MNAYRQILLLTLIAAGLAACGGGGGGSSPGAGAGSSSGGGGGAVADKFLSWQAPESYTDNTPLDPATDLDVFEVYIKQDGTFNENDLALAVVAATDPATGQVTTTFNLANLRPFLSGGVTYYVSVRAVAIGGEKSDFSGSAAFSF